MTDIDRQIEEALDAEDRAILEQFGEQGLFAQTFSVFQGKQGWIGFLTSFVMLVLFAGAVYCGWKFFQTADANEAIRWGAGVWVLLTMVAFMKIWFWIRMESNRVLREVKRLELQILRLKA